MDDVTFTKARAEAEPDRDARLMKMLQVARLNENFSPEELAILDAYNAGLPIATIEADVLVSRALYHRYIVGTPLSADQADLLARYQDYTKTHMSDLANRTSKLHAAFGVQIQGPDKSRDWELYSDPALFNQLSSAGQNRLELKYGRKGGLTFGGTSTPSSKDSTLLPPPGPTSPLSSVLVNNPAADLFGHDTQSETALVLGAGGVVVSAFNDSGSYGPNPQFTGWSNSTTSGASWTDRGALPLTAEGDAGDPVLARSNSTGTILLSTLGFNTGSLVPVYRSTDNGATFGPVAADGAAGGGGGFHDKEWIVCDNAMGGGRVPGGNFYCFWRDFGDPGGMTFTRSTDDGLTWTDRQVLYSDPIYGFGQGAWPVVSANHSVYAFWLAPDPTISFYQIQFRKSTDKGLTFGPTMSAANLRTTGSNGNLGLSGGFRSNAFPQVVAHPVDANQLYMVWNDKGITPSTDKANIYFSQTTDGGTTWSAPIQVNTDAGTHDQFFPTIAITPDGTGLFVSWYDRRNDPANSLIGIYARNATISGTTVTWGPDYPVTNTSFPVVIGQDTYINTTYMGDYDQSAADNSFYYRTWGDNTLPVLAHAHQPDVRFVKVPKAGPGSILSANGSALTAESCTPANGAPDPNEIVTYNLTVKNGGTSPTTNVVGTLQASGGISSPSAPQSYGAIAPGASVTRAFTFTANGACGGTITPSLQLQDGASNEGTLTYGPIGLGVMTLGAPTTYSSGGVAVVIPDPGDMTPQVINVPAAGTIANVKVKVRIASTWPGDLTISLVSPNGTEVVLENDPSDPFGTGFGSGSLDCSGTFTVFDDAAATSILAGSSPWAGSFRPVSPLSAMNGGPANGNWTLKIHDIIGGDSNTLYCWQIEVTAGTPVCNACLPSADVSIIGSASPSPIVSAGGNITYTYTATNNGA
ncbi:MAG: proprotein convertase P-domain-containing protein, partial [Acidobacteriota bacterium]|nr:proprotein convertase P-domain-containing protein [Acidobacteriota bacterium]